MSAAPMNLAALLPITVYGSSISYFTGKLENYFRIKGVPYTLQALAGRHHTTVIRQKTGSTQMPAVALGDGRWMTDSSAIIAWFETAFPTPAITPSNPLQRFFSLLLEDYTDEWLWRPAMHYRWHYGAGARYASAHLADELAADVPLPALLKRQFITLRQRKGYTSGDGIDRHAVAGVEAIYHRTLHHLETILGHRPFLLGSTPSLADIGFSGPIFRHFALDPVPAQIMRQQAPAVWEWAARLWNYRGNTESGPWQQGVPGDWGPVLSDIGRDYLPYLCANIDAVAAGKRRFDAQIGDVHYRKARSSRYRVWCLQQLREHFNALSQENQGEARQLLEVHACWEPMWRHTTLPIDTQVCAQLPFYSKDKMIDVYD
jgi:glutathione S-transferase